MVTRRDILKSIGIIGMAAAASRLGGIDIAKAKYRKEVINNFTRWQGQPLARITELYQRVRSEPSVDAEVTTVLGRDDVVRVRRLVKGQTIFKHNDLWVETPRGYIYATLVQPMYHHLPSVPTADLGEGRWGELIVPTSEAFRKPSPYDKDASANLVFYGNIFRLTELVTGADGNQWYKIKEIYQSIYIRASHIRLIEPAQLEPITPEIEARDKHLEINLTDQTITAFEYNEPVWISPMSSGIWQGDTPEGRHHIYDKRISTRMTASLASDDPDYYNLPGVPFTCFFTLKGVGTHGTYWHNDYGRERSHGCVNLPNSAAQWVWRWTTPIADTDALYYNVKRASEGTRVEVIRP